MNSERLKPLKEIVRRNIFILADAAANFSDDIFNFLSESEPAQQPANAHEKQKQILTKQEVAELLQVSIRSINNRMKEGLPFVGVGRNVRFVREDVLKWANSGNIKTGNKKSDAYVKVISLTVHDRQRKTK